MRWRILRAARHWTSSGEHRLALIGAVLLTAGAAAVLTWEPLRHAVLGAESPPTVRLMALSADEPAPEPAKR